MNAPVDGSVPGQSWLYSEKQVNVLLQYAQKLHQVRGPCTFDFDVYLEQLSDQPFLFSLRMAWRKKKITIAAACSTELIQSPHLSRAKESQILHTHFTHERYFSIHLFCKTFGNQKCKYEIQL